MGPQAVPGAIAAGARTFKSASAAHRNLAFNLKAAQTCTAEGYTFRVIAFPKTGEESFAVRLSQAGSSSGGSTMVFFRHRERIGAVNVVGVDNPSLVVALARKALRRLG